MNTLTQLRRLNPQSGRAWPVIVLLQLLWLLTGPVQAGSLDAVLNPDGTVRAGARGSFSTAGYRLGTDISGQPTFHSESTQSVSINDTEAIVLSPTSIASNGTDNDISSQANLILH